MATPKVTRESTPSYLLLAVKILLVLLILFLLPKLVTGGRSNGRKRIKRGELEENSIRILCEKEVCGSFIPEESMNCVLVCVSPACYQTLYGEEPLEDGEIDIVRAKDFELCVKNELRRARKRPREMF